MLLAVGLTVVASLTAFLFYMLYFKEGPARMEPSPMIIVKSKQTTPRPAIKATPTPAPKAATPAPAPKTPQPRAGLQKSRPRPARHASRKAASGPFSPELGARAFRKHNGALSHCFNKHSAGDAPEIKLQVISTITADGKVSAVRLEPVAQGDTLLGKCITNVAGTVRYPAHDRPRVNFVQPLRVKRQQP